MNTREKAIELFEKLSPSRQQTLLRKARKYMAENPGAADNDGFWRFLSARKITELAYAAN